MRRPLLLSTLLALGVLPPLPTPRREVDLAAAEKLIADLQAAGIDAQELADLTGPEDFVLKGRLALQVHAAKKAMGERDASATSLVNMVDNLLAGGTAPGFPHGIIDLSDGKPKDVRHEGKLLATVHPHPGAVGVDNVDFTPPHVATVLLKSLDRLAPAAASLTESMRGLASAARRINAAIDRPVRDRAKQRAAKKARARTTARRGW